MGLLEWVWRFFILFAVVMCAFLISRSQGMQDTVNKLCSLCSRSTYRIRLERPVVLARFLSFYWFVSIDWHIMKKQYGGYLNRPVFTQTSYCKCTLGKYNSQPLWSSTARASFYQLHLQLIDQCLASPDALNNLLERLTNVLKVAQLEVDLPAEPYPHPIAVAEHRDHGVVL